MRAKVVKSVGRVFEILELFDKKRSPLTATEISKTLGYPHTSGVALINSMRELGYLTHDAATRTYCPSFKVTQVSEWVVSNVHEETAILNVMGELHEAVDETINLSRQTGDFVRFVHGIESTKLLSIRVRKGAMMPLIASHTGMVALATYPDHDLRRIVQRIKERDHLDRPELAIADVMQKVRDIRRDRYSKGYDIYMEGVGIIAFPLPSSTGGLPFVVAIAGPTERIRSNEQDILRLAKRITRKHKLELAYPG